MNDYNNGEIWGEFYVYAHMTPCGDIFYIGKGIGKRAYNFKNRSARWLRKVAKHGTPKVQIILNNLLEKTAFFLEQQIILKLRKDGVDLCNMTNGGEGATGAVRSEETKNKIAKANVGRVVPQDIREKISKSVHKAMTPEIRALFSKSSKNRKHSEETKAKMSLAQTGKLHGPMSEDTKIKLSNLCSGWTHTEKAKLKISAASKGRVASPETRRKRSESRTGRRWVTNGKENKAIFSNEKLPDGWVYGLTKRKANE